MASERERMPEEPEPGGEDVSFEGQVDMGENSGISAEEMGGESPVAEASPAVSETTPEKPGEGRAWQRGWRLLATAIMVLVFARAARRAWRRFRRG